MAYVVDNLIAYRVLTMLVKPFNETEAFKLGIIDADGKNLIPASKFTKTEQRSAYTYLHRLVFNLKKLLNKLPGGESKTKNIVAAFFLLKEAYNKNTVRIDESQLERIISLLDDGVILAEEELVVEEFLSLLNEDAPANATGAAVSTDAPVIRKRRAPRRFAKFVVNDEVYKKFTNGKSKYRKWSEYLDLEDEGQKQIYTFAKKNPNGVIILQNGKDTKSIRFNRRGGGSWSKIKRPSKQINNEVI
jgi:hypothetical protein